MRNKKIRYFLKGSGYFTSRGKIAQCYFAIWRHYIPNGYFAASAKVALTLIPNQTLTLIPTLTLTQTLTQTEEKFCLFVIQPEVCFVLVVLFVKISL